MNNRIYHALFCFGFLMLSILFASVSLAQSTGYTVTGTIELQQTGDIMLGMKSEQEEKNKQSPRLGIQIKVGPEDVRLGQVKFTIENVSAGTYAIQCFQDTNGNGKMDFGLFGIPKEPWGNYRDFRPKFRGPKFNEIAFKVDRDITDITLRMRVR